MASLISIPIERGTKTWIDVTDPTPENLTDLVDKYGLHPAFVNDCLDPSHLPKVEYAGDTTFFIVRALDDQFDEEADTVQRLTRKVAILVTASTVLTIHRLDQKFLEELRAQWQADGVKRTQSHLVNSLLARAISSYGPLTTRVSERVDQLEEAVFRRKKKVDLIAEAYALKRVMSITDRLLRLMEEIVPVPAARDREAPFVRNLHHRIRRVLFASDDLETRIDHLLQLHLAIESNRTNEVMRLLTVFSAFFLPLSFIAGVYGMNFRFMPELEWPYGYLLALLLMAGVAAAIWIWFRKNGLLGK